MAAICYEGGDGRIYVTYQNLEDQARSGSVDAFQLMRNLNHTLNGSSDEDLVVHAYTDFFGENYTAVGSRGGWDSIEYMAAERL